MRLKNVSTEQRVGIVGCKHTTRDLMAGMIRHGMQPDHCITINPGKGRSQQVAGYMDLRPFLEAQEIPYTTAEKYSLKSDADRETLLGLELDAVFVNGWQRLIPQWWLAELRIGAFGMHGSSRPLPHGRGRSPLNWSLIQGKDVFYTHLFRYDPGVDDGAILAVQMFEITPFDSCLTLHFKNTIAMVKLVVANMPALFAGEAEFTVQSAEGATYYPQRTAEDGIIYWGDRTLEIYNLIRGVTKPFPGAYSFLNDDPEDKIVIWDAIPFDHSLDWPGSQPGDILEVMFDGSFVVKTGDSTLLVRGSEGHTFTATDIGSVLTHCDIPRKNWEGLPD